jgi:hypothetical protein
MAVLLVSLEQNAGRVLGLLHVRLVERIDVENGAGNRGRDFPSDKLRAERERFRNIDGHDRRTAASQDTDSGSRAFRRCSRHARERTGGHCRTPQALRSTHRQSG